MEVKNSVIKALIAECDSALRMLKLRTPDDYSVDVHIWNWMQFWKIQAKASTEEEYFKILDTFELKKDVNPIAKREVYTDTYSLGNDCDLEIRVPPAWSIDRRKEEEARRLDNACQNLNVTLCKNTTPEEKLATKKKIVEFMGNFND
jgi:hypothetical protein